MYINMQSDPTHASLHAICHPYTCQRRLAPNLDVDLVNHTLVTGIPSFDNSAHICQDQSSVLPSSPSLHDAGISFSDLMATEPSMGVSLSPTMGNLLEQLTRFNVDIQAKSACSVSPKSAPGTRNGRRVEQWKRSKRLYELQSRNSYSKRRVSRDDHVHTPGVSRTRHGRHGM
jgi:hypothetical protein